ncbi:PepSY domain-containing protein [Niveispirillum sp.]|uniref:PepSY domain-containing protein n=1 Tax=Niveispirillum sp. TaxID=1917217 RepID=UPI001B4346CF|nr:PepSY domain-containing protein [Niveispirillum sp.]MBP7339055.1 PepSY domain-containing protein [Niveispirillum sp.]
MPYPRLLAGLLLSGSLATGAYAFAQGAGTAAPAAAPQAAAADLLSMPALLDRLAAQGYRDARSIERKSDKLVEVKATGPDGRRQELYVDARSGEILKVERD